MPSLATTNNPGGISKRCLTLLREDIGVFHFNNVLRCFFAEFIFEYLQIGTEKVTNSLSAPVVIFFDVASLGFSGKTPFLGHVSDLDLESIGQMADVIHATLITKN